MVVKAGYKHTDERGIPETWEIKSCADICIKIQDGTHFSPKPGGRDFLYLTSKNVRFGALDISEADRISVEQHQSIYKRCDVRYGDPLLTKDGANTGNAALNNLKEEFSLLSSVAFLRFDPNKHVAGYFLQQILSTAGQQQIKGEVSGNAITRLTLEKINKLRFIVAPFPEQQAIATVLSDMDSLIASLDQLIAKKRNLKQAAMQQLLTGKKRLAGFMGAWGKVTFERIFDRINTRNYQIPVSEYHKSGKFPIVDQGKYLISGYSDIENKHFPCPIGGVIVFGDHTCITKFVNFDFIVGADGTQILMTKEAQCARFYAYQLELSGIQPTGYNRHFKLLKERIFLMPTLPEQIAIITILSDMDAEINKLEAGLVKNRLIKRGMMQELLTGKTRLLGD